MNHLKYLTKEKSELILMREIDMISRGKSYFHRINDMINNRDRFLSILKQQIESYADDNVFEHVQQLAGEAINPETRNKKIDNILANIRGLRLLNIELIEEIQRWRSIYIDIRKQSTMPVSWEPIVFMFRQQNYLLKMIGDVSFVFGSQIDGLTFSTGNDPFILRPLRSVNQELVAKLEVDETMHVRIADCMEILAK
jgi:hypothetical protein